MNDLDKKSIETRLQRLKECLAKLEPLAEQGLEEFTSNHAFGDIAERNLQVAIQCCLDIGNHLVSTLAMKQPEEYRDIFMILGEEGIIPLELAKKMAPLAGLRNILVHEYLQIELEKIYQTLQELRDFDEFSGWILNFIEKES